MSTNVFSPILVINTGKRLALVVSGPGADVVTGNVAKLLPARPVLSPQAVSYTHLDVYKRQVIRCSHLY